MKGWFWTVINKRRVTLQDVAKATGYSINTISHALKNKPDIAPATREKIQQVAREMGYIRNEMARSLRSGRTKTLGVIVGGMSNPFYGLMADAIQDAAMKLGYTLLILCSRDQEDIEQQVLETAIRRQVDGVLLFPSWSSARSIKLLKDNGIPYVLMARYLEKGQD
ncbi:MAG: LacI family DNA-binding transcriptional regulator, partial [Clostridia bacterium]|nr:LacI family DNA-binding transcriptional regulator [Clostridia bacterium]